MSQIVPYLPAFAGGLALGIIPTGLYVLLLRDDRKRLRKRLNGIFATAKRIDNVWSRSALRASHWTEMFLEIAPYEEV